MLVEIDLAVADDPVAHRWLDRILHKVDDGWHIWDVPTEVDSADFEDSSWVRDRGSKGEWVRELLLASLKPGAWSSAPHGRRLLVTTSPIQTHELGPEDAARLAEEPLVVLVENRNSDGAFVERAATECDRALGRLWRRSGRPVQVDSTGGIGELPEEIERRCQGRAVRPRLVVVVDSDRKAPDMDESPEARRVRKVCEAYGVPCWVLAKRESENYLPRALLDGRRNAGLEHARRVGAWDRLNELQKDFFDMKEGLASNPTAAEEELFEDLPTEDVRTLGTGFGPNVWKCWHLHMPIKKELLERGGADLKLGIELVRKAV